MSRPGPGPRLRDQHGQPWPWPPLAPEPAVPQPSPGGTVPAGRHEPDRPPVQDGSRAPKAFQHPDVGSAPARCWLFFLPGAFTPVCTAELGWVDDLAERLAPTGAGLRVITCDSAAVLRKMADETGVRVPLLSDFWPHGAAAQAVGEFDTLTGRPHRSSVLVDAAGTVLARVRAATGDQRTLRDHLQATGLD